METKSVLPNMKHLRFRKALENAIAQGGADLDAEEILVVVAHFLGQITALQDQRKFTGEQVMEMISKNIEQGNKEVLDSVFGETGGNA